MKTFSSRRYRNASLLLLSGLLCWLVYRGLVDSLHNPSFISGWLLLGLCLFLMFYNVRKKLPSVPMLRSSTWLQLHIYLGVLAGFLFLLHIRFMMPNGAFELVLAGMFVATFLSGLFGLYITRSLPPRLNRVGEPVIFERIPIIRRQIQDSVETIVLDSIEQTESNTIAEFYRDHLAGLFRKPSNVWRQLFAAGDRADTLKQKAHALKRYLDQDESLIMDRILEHVDAKSVLDFQYARQALLKYWLFLHIPVTYSLIILAAFHLMLSYAYFGGVF